MDIVVSESYSIQLILELAMMITGFAIKRNFDNDSFKKLFVYWVLFSSVCFLFLLGAYAVEFFGSFDLEINYKKFSIFIAGFFAIAVLSEYIDKKYLDIDDHYLSSVVVIFALGILALIVYSLYQAFT